jgi:phosphotransacetylase
MSKLEAIRKWCADQGSTPLICFVQGTDPEVIKLAKILIQEELAEVILLGDELEVYDQCRIYRVNESLLYGVINPADHAEIEYYTDLYLAQHPDEEAKKAARAIKQPEVLAQLMQSDGAVDLFIADLTSWQGAG